MLLKDMHRKPQKLNMIPVCEPSLSLKEYIYVFKALRSNWLTCGGEFVNRLEQGIAKYHNAKYGIALSSGTAALHMALLALNIGKGDEVIVPSLSFVAVASMVKLVGATPVIVDVDKDDWLISTNCIEKAITNKTKAIIPVHLYGNRCNMNTINSIAGKYSIKVIEDSCEATGTPINSDISCLSFQSTKTATCGEGGMCITNNKDLADRIRFLKDHAMTADRKYYHTEVGYNYRLTEIQAAIGCAQLERLDELLTKKEHIYSIYCNILKDIEGITLQQYNQGSWHWVTAILVEPSFGINRDELMLKLKDAGIETRVMFYPIHLQPPYRERIHSKKDIAIPKDYCPIATELSNKGMYLPSGVNLRKFQVEYICSKIIEYKQ